MKIAVITGGMLEESSTLQFLRLEKPDKFIGVDKGLAFMHAHKIMPDLIVGDFDSIADGILDDYAGKVPIRRFCPQKDSTDTEIGLRAAIEMGAQEIVLLGATGTRLDHILGNIQILCIALQEGVDAYIQDAHNRIRLINGEKNIKREQMFGSYISFLPLTTQVKGLTLQGFKYPLEKAALTSDNSLGISNEIVADEAEISLEEGILIMIEAQD